MLASRRPPDVLRRGEGGFPGAEAPGFYACAPNGADWAGFVASGGGIKDKKDSKDTKDAQGMTCCPSLMVLAVLSVLISSAKSASMPLTPSRPLHILPPKSSTRPKSPETHEIAHREAHP